MKIFQVTDLHLFPNAQQDLHGVVCYETAHAIFDHVANEISSDDILVLSGDLAEGGKAGAYRLLNELLEPFGNTQTFIMPGNHDDEQVMRETLGPSPKCVNRFMAPICCAFEGVSNCRIFTLNSQDMGKTSGLVSDHQLKLLEKALKITENDLYVFIHHHVIGIGGFMDFFKLKKSYSLLELLDNPKIRAVVCGHVHQEFDFLASDRGFNNPVRFLGTPSTCYQIKPGHIWLTQDREARPGYRIIDVDDTKPQGFETTVVRV